MDCKNDEAQHLVCSVVRFDPEFNFGRFEFVIWSCAALEIIQGRKFDLMGLPPQTRRPTRTALEELG